MRRTPSNKFFGRDKDLEKIHEKLKQGDVAIAAFYTTISGMGGIGKTELALQYATRKQADYPGGVCWVDVGGGDMGIKICSFAREGLKMRVPEEGELSDRVGYCWQNWGREGDVLLVLDDVVAYDAIAPYLPPVGSRFKVLVTTRSQDLDPKRFKEVGLLVLDEATSLEVLRSFLQDREGGRIDDDLEAAKGLCQWLGYLPLGLELVGQYLRTHQDLSLQEMHARLEKQRLEEGALKDKITAVFELSWQELDEDEQELACLLGLFAPAPIPWEFVEGCFPDRDKVQLETIRDEILCGLSLLEREGKGVYKLHQLTREFLQYKLKRSPWCDRPKQGFWQRLRARFKTPCSKSDELKRKCVRVMVEVAKDMPETPTLEHIEQFSILILHWEEVIANLCNWIENEDLILPFLGLGGYYKGQGLYKKAESWQKQSLSICRDRLGEDHPDVASSLNNLAGLYSSQGRYEEAEPLYSQALALRRKRLGEDHPHVASSLNNLASLYSSQGRYEEAEPLFSQALALRRKRLGEDHPHVASSLNNLASLYQSQGRYEEAEPLYSQALALSRKLLGEDHPDVATSLNNLASLYTSQGRYEEAEPLFSQALDLSRKRLGEDHPHVASSLNNLASLYQSQGRYEEAEPLFSQALDLSRKLLGEDHPDVASSLNNLAELYSSQGRYEEAESLFSQAILIIVNRLGFEHPNSKTLIQNFGYCLQKAIAVGQRDKLGNHPITQDILAQIDAASKGE
ncbi:MAG: tetratricopeptide repeat protein [Cyanobacteria bacterium SBLK]|nr:tetratricopeptide repeat protein [Cyanobacteria bacterium SBLK]